MTSTQINYLRDFAITHLPRAQAVRAQVRRYGGDLYSQLAFTAVMVRGNAGTTAIEFAAASVLESVCLLQQPTLKAKERADVLHQLTSAANTLCLHTGKPIEWLALAALEPEPIEPAAPPAKPPPSIAGQWLSTKKAAEALSFADQTLRNWVTTGGYPPGLSAPTKVKGRSKWSGDEILAVLNRK